LSGPSGRFIFAARRIFPPDVSFLHRGHSLIGQLELLAAASVYISVPASALREQDVVHFIDNTSALYGMVKGYSPVPDSLNIIRAFHAANIALRANVWFNYVASKANVADLPSRGSLDEMASCLRKAVPSFSLDEDVVECVIPACPSDLSALWPAVMSQLRPRAASRSRRQSWRQGGRRVKPY
jgi:hypothetical protein